MASQTIAMTADETNKKNNLPVGRVDLDFNQAVGSGYQNYG
jgi:hypothetical protein